MIRDLAPGKPTSFFLPELLRSLPFAHHPKAIQIESASNGWIRNVLGSCFTDEDALLRSLRQRIGLFGPFTAPHAAEDRVRTLTDWYQFLTMIDDVAAITGPGSSSVDQIGQRCHSILDALTDTALPRDAVSHAARDLWNRTSPGLTVHQYARLVPAVTEFFEATLTEMRLSASGEIPDYETCMTLRADSFGWSFVRLATEYAVNVDMAAYLDDPVLAEIHHHAIRRIVLVNDLTSFRKEYRHNESTVTTVLSLWNDERSTFQETVSQLCDLAAYHQQRYHDTRSHLLDTMSISDSRIKTYITELDHFIAGSHEFHLLTPRYWGDLSVWDGSTFGWVDLTTDTARLLSHAPKVAS